MRKGAGRHRHALQNETSADWWGTKGGRDDGGGGVGKGGQVA